MCARVYTSIREVLLQVLWDGSKEGAHNRKILRLLTLARLKNQKTGKLDDTANPGFMTEAYLVRGVIGGTDKIPQRGCLVCPSDLGRSARAFDLATPRFDANYY